MKTCLHTTTKTNLQGSRQCTRCHAVLVRPEIKPSMRIYRKGQ